MWFVECCKVRCMELSRVAIPKKFAQSTRLCDFEKKEGGWKRVDGVSQVKVKGTPVVGKRVSLLCAMVRGWEQ